MHSPVWIYSSHLQSFLQENPLHTNTIVLLMEVFTCCFNQPAACPWSCDVPGVLVKNQPVLRCQETTHQQKGTPLGKWLELKTNNFTLLRTNNLEVSKKDPRKIAQAPLNLACFNFLHFSTNPSNPNPQDLGKQKSRKNAILCTPFEPISEKDESRVFKADENRPLEKDWKPPFQVRKCRFQGG